MRVFQAEKATHANTPRGELAAVPGEEQGWGGVSQEERGEGPAQTGSCLRQEGTWHLTLRLSREVV